MKLWEKRFKDRKEDPFLERFNASITEDFFLFGAEIEASRAYAKALYKAGILEESELESILNGLDKVVEKVKRGIDARKYEDVHTLVESLLIDEIGDVGKKLHTGRSRNEQVVTDEKIWLRHRLIGLIELVKELQSTVIEIAEENFDVIFPGYTHLQQAQPVLFSHYIMSLFWALERDKERVLMALKRLTTLPLGSGALAGTSVPLDRDYLTNELGFRKPTENSMDAVADRSFILDTLFAISMIALDLSRYSEDFIIYSSREFGFIELEDHISTSSSLMPQKKNPDFFELIRGKVGRFISYLDSLMITVKGLPMTYNKDLQEDKVPIFRAVSEIEEILVVFNKCLKGIHPVPDKIRAKMDSFMLATDLVDYLVEKGVPFREAHGIVGEIVFAAQKEGKELRELSIDEFKKFSDVFDEEVFEVFDFEKSVRNKKTYGSTNPEAVRKQIEKAREILKD